MLDFLSFFFFFKHIKCIVEITSEYLGDISASSQLSYICPVLLGNAKDPEKLGKVKALPFLRVQYLRKNSKEESVCRLAEEEFKSARVHWLQTNAHSQQPII